MDRSPLFALVAFGALFVVVAIASARDPLPRRHYAWCVVVAVALLIGVHVLFAMRRWDSPVSWLFLDPAAHWIVYLVDVATALALFRWVGRRLIDIKRSRWWAVLCIVPGLNVAMVIALLFPATRYNPLIDN